MTASDIIGRLIKKYGGIGNRGRYVVVPEMRLGSGYRHDHERRIDLWCLDAYPRNGNPAISYEVKVSRPDFLSDIKDPIKQRGALAYSNEFYYAAPQGLIKPNELPVHAGLLEFDPAEMGDPYYHGEVVVPAPHRDKLRPSWPFVVSLMRRAGTVSFPSETCFCCGALPCQCSIKETKREA